MINQLIFVLDTFIVDVWYNMSDVILNGIADDCITYGSNL